MLLQRFSNNAGISVISQRSSMSNGALHTCTPVPRLSSTASERGYRFITAFKKGSNEGFSSSTSTSSSKFGVEREGESWTLYAGNKNYNVTDKYLWSVAPAAAVGLGALALVFGPVLIGFAIAGSAIAFTVSIGAFVVVPLIVFGLGAGAVAMGFGLFVPLAVAGGFALAGGLALNLLGKAVLPSSTKSGKQSASQQSAGQKGPTINVKPAEDPEEAEMKRASQELRDFDEMLADREQRRRMDNWRETKNTPRE